MAGELSGVGQIPEKLGKAGIILPIPTTWEPIKNPEENLKKWGWESEILDREIFGRIKGFSSEGKPQYELILDEFNKGTSFLEFGKYLFGPLAEWLGAQIGENCYDTDLIAATAKRAGAERILNTPDRLLGTYILSTMLGDGGGVGGKPPEGYVGGGVGGEGESEYMKEQKEYLRYLEEHFPNLYGSLYKDATDIIESIVDSLKRDGYGRYIYRKGA